MTIEDHLSAARLDSRGLAVLGAGGGGLGDATCKALAGAGADLICVDIDKRQAETIAEETGGEPYVADVTNRREMDALFAHADARFGTRFAGVVDIVGMARNARISEMDDDAIGRQFDIVLRHAILTVQIAGPILARLGRGSLTFVGSLSGTLAVPNQTFYGIAKASLHHLVQCAALELGPSGVRVNGVSPGFISTPRLRQMLPPEMWDQLAAGNPLRRVAQPEDIAKAILFLVSDMADYVTGNLLRLDGGLSGSLSLPQTDALRQVQQ